MSSRHSMVNVKVIAPHAGGQQIRHLTVRILLPRRHACVPNQLSHNHPYVSCN